jgi:hypothetical protein
MLWRYNVMWPDSGKAAWQGLAHAWGLFVANAFAVPALLAMVSVFMPGRFLGLGLVSTHLWALTLLAALYWGDVRFRAPYDPVIILMALEAYAVALSVAWAVGKRLLRRVRSRRRTSPSRQRDER